MVNTMQVGWHSRLIVLGHRRSAYRRAPVSFFGCQLSAATFTRDSRNPFERQGVPLVP